MKLFQTTAALAAIVAGGALVHTQDANAAVVDYVELSVGAVADADVNGFGLDGQGAYGIALGKDFGPVRTEVGVSRLNADANLGGLTIDTEATVYSGAVYLDFGAGDRTNFFIGAGVDYVDASAQVFGTSFGAEGTGYSYAGGVSHRLSETLTLEAQYKHLEADLSNGVDLSADVATIGLRAAF